MFNLNPLINSSGIFRQIPSHPPHFIYERSDFFHTHNNLRPLPILITVKSNFLTARPIIMSVSSVSTNISLSYYLRKETTDVNIQQWIQEFLGEYDLNTQLDILLDIFDEALDLETNLQEAVVTAWNYLQATELYRVRYDTLDQFKTTINYAGNLEPIILEYRQRIHRATKAMNTILTNWHLDLATDLPYEIQPPVLSKHLTEAIAKLSYLVPYDRALPEFHSVIQSRLNNTLPGQHKATYLTKQDVDNARHNLSPVQPESMQDIIGSSRTPNPSVLASITSYHTSTSYNGTYFPCHPINYLDSFVESGSDSEQETLSVASDYTPAPSHQRSKTRSSELAITSDSPTSKSKRCQCPTEFKNLVKQLLNDSNHNIERFQLFVAGMNMGIHKMCRSDLRNFVKHSISLLTNITSEEIISRARLAFEHRASLDQFRNINYAWFARSAREIAPAELLEPFRFPSNIKPEFTFNAFAIMERFAGHNAALRWDRDGNLLIPNLLNYIREDRRLYEMIGQEFDMYEHHFQPHTSKPKMGFLRNMFYSITQQLVRQDPAWYALNAACRPSHDWRLISYPYVAKKVVPGERTGFAHTDVNIATWVEYGHGANQLTSSVSLDQEKPTDCTEIVPGFHHNAIAWYNRLVNRRTKPTGTTTNAVKLYLPEDEQSFGSFQPQVCGPGDVRITRPEIIHGSTSNATISRRVIYPWFTAIQEDHSTLEISGQLSWAEVAACHRDMLAPRSGVGGDTVSFSCPVYRFAAGIHMPSSSALSDALIGRRSWEDPEVLLERDILLGDNAQASHDYVRRTRKELIKNFKTSFQKMVTIEKSAFGTNSFFTT